ncbi:LOW QUALITY PROTEIN: protein ABIL1-like [Dioscorea cayenensis subsp. rotundata]|uniref:LOW QUALITY PROTEIN: protein ABIL1-like n=1 Tax=Dioscorea cayennensis subsp. rotundata TaxID=55577 RepID=A0AB40B2X8_DIOCR|nr:LOW QUALITY PROTEIN: protein ABIL1-like [Dioscorea cayenensis subsp. rotundata]
MQQWRPENATALTFDEVSMERSKSFVKALQELKNLRPQLYSAAEYCEKSYLHNEQKQMVLDNLKDYAVRALVNAVDHLGTVAYKLTELLEQQTMDVSTVELKISCLNQRILTCQTYTDLEGLRQQQMSPPTPRHHKHYILPNSNSRRMSGSLHSQTDVAQNHIQAEAHPCPPGTHASKTLSWHLASESINSPSNGAATPTRSIGDHTVSKVTSEVFHLLEEAVAPLPLSSHLQSAVRTPTSNVAQPKFGLMGSHLTEMQKPLTAFRSFGNAGTIEVYRPVRNKSMLATLFAKTKSAKQKRTLVS